MLTLLYLLSSALFKPSGLVCVLASGRTRLDDSRRMELVSATLASLASPQSLSPKDGVSASSSQPSGRALQHHRPRVSFKTTSGDLDSTTTDRSVRSRTRSSFAVRQVGSSCAPSPPISGCLILRWDSNLQHCPSSSPTSTRVMDRSKDGTQAKVDAFSSGWATMARLHGSRYALYLLLSDLLTLLTTALVYVYQATRRVCLSVGDAGTNSERSLRLNFGSASPFSGSLFHAAVDPTFLVSVDCPVKQDGQFVVCQRQIQLEILRCFRVLTALNLVIRNSITFYSTVSLLLFFLTGRTQPLSLPSLVWHPFFGVRLQSAIFGTSSKMVVRVWIYVDCPFFLVAFAILWFSRSGLPRNDVGRHPYLSGGSSPSTAEQVASEDDLWFHPSSGQVWHRLFNSGGGHCLLLSLSPQAAPAVVRQDLANVIESDLDRRDYSSPYLRIGDPLVESTSHLQQQDVIEAQIARLRLDGVLSTMDGSLSPSLALDAHPLELADLRALALYFHLESVTVFDDDTGETLEYFKPSSFAPEWTVSGPAAHLVYSRIGQHFQRLESLTDIDMVNVVSRRITHTFDPIRPS